MKSYLYISVTNICNKPLMNPKSGKKEKEGKERRGEERRGEERRGEERRKKPKNHSKLLLSLIFHTNSSAHPLGSNFKALSKTPNSSM